MGPPLSRIAGMAAITSCGTDPAGPRTHLVVEFMPRDRGHLPGPRTGGPPHPGRVTSATSAAAEREVRCGITRSPTTRSPRGIASHSMADAAPPQPAPERLAAIRDQLKLLADYL